MLMFGSCTHYDGQVWYEPLSNVHSIKSKPIEEVEKLMLESDDCVTLVFKSKTFNGIVDPHNTDLLESSGPGKLEKNT